MRRKLLKNLKFTGNVYTFGFSNMNLTITTEGFPVLGETLYTNQDFFFSCGGKALNQAITTKRLGAHVSLISMVSTDEYGKELLKCLEENDINTNYLFRSSEKSGLSIINTNEFGQNKIICCPGINRLLSEIKDFSGIPIKKGDIVICSLEVSQKVLLPFIRECYEREAIIIVDASSRNAEEDNVQLYPFIDILKPNEVEMLRFGQENSTLTQRLETMKEKGITLPLISLGENGIVYLDDQVRTIPSLKVKAVDTTGAGDIFIGTVASMLSSNNYNITESLVLAVIASGLSVCMKGSIASIPKVEEIKKVYEERTINVI